MLVCNKCLMQQAKKLLHLFSRGRGLSSVQCGAHLLTRLEYGCDLPNLARDLHHCVVDMVPNAKVLREGVEQEI